MSENLCPCCGNRKGCDCYSAQSPQFRQLAEAQAARDRAFAASNADLEKRREMKRQLAVYSARLTFSEELAEVQARITALEKALSEAHEMLYVEPSPAESCGEGATKSQQEYDIDRAYEGLDADPRREAMERVCKMARGLVERLKVVHEDDRYKAVWQMYYIHGAVYQGPTYTEELAAVDDALAALDKEADHAE
jgi:hypothetical protein